MYIVGRRALRGSYLAPSSHNPYQGTPNIGCEISKIFRMASQILCGRAYQGPNRPNLFGLYTVVSDGCHRQGRDPYVQLSDILKIVVRLRETTRPTFAAPWSKLRWQARFPSISLATHEVPAPMSKVKHTAVLIRVEYILEEILLWIQPIDRLA
jgi:hypothetical protein